MENTTHPSEEPLPKANALTALISTVTYLNRLHCDTEVSLENKMSTMVRWKINHLL